MSEFLTQSRLYSNAGVIRSYDKYVILKKDERLIVKTHHYRIISSFVL